jgi:lipoic acid synthetase
MLPTKSGLMLGLGESYKEVEATLRDLLEAGCSILTLGQYLQPTRQHLKVERFIAPREFDHWKERALKMGFSQVASGPLVRSSYRAKELYQGLVVPPSGNDGVQP